MTQHAAGEEDSSHAVYTAEPGTRSAEALGLLASWAATEQAGAPAPPG